MNYFSHDEIVCRCGCGFEAISLDTLDCANALRTKLNKSIPCNSACRCPERNDQVGGEKQSYHMGRYCTRPALIDDHGSIHSTTCQIASLAMDLGIPSHSDRETLIDHLEKHFPKMSYGVYSWGIHIDSRTSVGKQRKKWSGK